jgi:Domain of unknown function (DUF4304)
VAGEAGGYGAVSVFAGLGYGLTSGTLRHNKMLHMSGTLGELRLRMNAELKTTVLPVLRSHSFKGSFPHFRRMREGVVDLLTFQFSLYGGSFVVEIAQCGAEGFTTSWGKHIPANKVSAWDLNIRQRIGPDKIGVNDPWFRFDLDGVKVAAAQFLNELPRAEEWWRSRPSLNS